MLDEFCFISITYCWQVVVKRKDHFHYGIAVALAGLFNMWTWTAKKPRPYVMYCIIMSY